MTTVISVENLSKVYRLGQIGTGTISYDLKLWWAKTRGKPNPMLRIGETDHGNLIGEDLWALKDVSFTVEQGEVLGIIGRNGAGKSTLLKILSRVTAPTSGRVRVKGRIASLLEVGTGFHRELTGRENTYLNGAILGMSRSEIDRKFDEIVDFSGVEKFIDTPVKRYSSGMYVRLAFAVAAYLEPEILVVDEVLAVGDAEFQKKCLGKMGDVAKEGRTVLFVSHNMGAIQQLCPISIFLQRGQLMNIGPSSAIVGEYLNIFSFNDFSPFDFRNPERSGNKKIILSGGRVIDHNGKITSAIIAGHPLTFEFDYENHLGLEDVKISLTIFNGSGIAVTNTNTSLTMADIRNLGKKGCFRCVIDRTPFMLDDYRVAIAVHNSGFITDLIPNALTFTVDSSIFFPTLRTPDKRYSTMTVDHHWEHTAL